MENKTYVLLDSLDATAPIYQTLPNGQRSQIKKMPFYRPLLQVTFVDKDGKNRTIRYKRNSDKIFQDEQIKDGILANERFTDAERDDLRFRNGMLVTRLPIAHRFLEAHPEDEAFEGISDVKPTFKLLDKKVEAKITNKDLKRRLEAANKIFDLSLSEAKAMLIRLNGVYFETPSEIEDCQNLLINYLDDTDEKGVEEILKDELNVDEKTTVLIGKCINAGILSFDKVEGKVSKLLKGGEWKAIRDMSNQYSASEKERLFSDFLNTTDGALLKTDLENSLNEFEEKPKGAKNKK